ncbi:MAG: hypothetical protein KF850_01525 [Labilithrix sp.]|nr:hypothetical protein [Labilithrix sp.]MBX3210693.1 hypothetical protein [Labilithrix sp.]
MALTTGGASRFALRVALFAVILAGTLLASRSAHAYPWMIRNEYTACSMCHADPSGAGIMTPYGRAQSEVLLRTHWGELDEEDPAKLGGFAFGAVQLPEWLDLQADVRSLLLHVAPPDPAPSTTRRVLMQADAATALRLGPFRASGSLGYAHEGALGASVTRGTEDRLVSRQHWAGMVFGDDEAFLVRAGRMNLPFGLRILEHTTFVRSATRTDINAAQQHGVALAYNKDGWRGEAMAILGNFQLRPDALRDRGASAYLEKSFLPNLAVGATSLVTHAELDLAARTSAFRQAHGLFGRYAPAKPVVIMLEADALVRSPKRQAIDVGATGIAQVDVEPVQGVHVAATGELLNERFGGDATSLGAWLSAFWFFLPHIDFRADLVYRSLPVADGRAGVVMGLAQFHGWL